MNVFSFKGRKIPANRSIPMIDKWNEIMNEAPPKEMGGYHRSPVTSRNQAGKDARQTTETTEEKSVGKRSSSSTQRKGKRKPSGKAFARGLGSNLADNFIEGVNYERTQSARNKIHSSEVEEDEDSRIPKLLNVKRVNTGDESPILASKSSFQKALR